MITQLTSRTRLVISLAAISMVAVLGVATVVANHPEIPGADPGRPVALVGGTIHPVAGPSIPNGILLFDKGKIVAVGEKIEIPKDALQIDIKGKHVYPGLIDAYTDLGLTEISAVRATKDQRETGRINPNVKAQVAFNPDSELIPVARSNGILLTGCAPSGGLISGQSAVMKLDGWSWEDMTVKPAAGMHINWPRVLSPSADWSGESQDKDKEEDKKSNQLKPLEQAFENARAYREARRKNTQQPIDAKWEAMIPVLEQKVPVVVHANRAADIKSAIAFAVRHNIRLIIAGGYDALECTQLLKRHQIPVIVGGVYRLPQNRDDGFDEAYTLPKRLHEAEIPFCIAGFGRFNAANVRNLPYHAATAAAYGLPPEIAIKAITSYPADILGIADRVGTLQPKKDATLIVCSGNPLEIPTHVERAYIGGREVDLNNRHKRLWNKYQEKYRRMGLVKEQN